MRVFATFATMQMKSRAIVLRVTKYGEQKMIVDMFTEAVGRMSAICRIPKTQKGKLKKQYFQPMSVLEVAFDYRQNLSLQHLLDARIALPFVSIPFHPLKLSITLFLAEFLSYSTRNEQQNVALYQYVENSLAWLDACSTTFSNFHLVFMMRFSRFIGIYPLTDDYHEGDFFDLRAACFTSQLPLHADYLVPADAERIGTLMRMDYETMRLFRMSHHDRNRIVDVLITYYRLHVPNFPELRSLSVMKELWA